MKSKTACPRLYPQAIEIAIKNRFEKDGFGKRAVILLSSENLRNSFRYFSQLRIEIKDESEEREDV